MKFTDSHCHLHMLDLTEFNGELSRVLDAAQQNGVENMLCVGTTLVDLPEILNIANQYDNIHASVGLHPNETAQNGEPTLQHLITLAHQSPKIVAIGETGLDYYRSSGDMGWQQERFRTHIQAARETKLPMIIHTRQAKEDTIKILQEERAYDAGGVFHCFTEDWDMAQAGLDMGFYISLSGIVTFKNATELQEIARKIPLEHLLIETDAPYLAPMPHRGKMNHPALVRLVGEFIATLRNIDPMEVAEKTTQNYHRLFKV